MALWIPTNRLTRHLLFWAGVTVLAGSTYILEDISNSGYFSHRAGVVTDLLFARLPTFMVYTYLLTYWLLPLVFRGQFVGFFAGVLLLNVAKWLLNDLLTYSLQFPLMHWLHEELPLRQDTWLFGSLFPGTAFWPSNVIAGLFICVKLFCQWYQKQTESQQLEREKLSHELTLLKLQLNPNFLFDSLRTLYHLTQTQPQQAPEVVLKLAHFLRYVLYESQEDTVPLDRELDVINDYIFLQRIIHDKLVEVSFTVRGGTKNQRVVPLLLFSIVESTFRQLPAELTEPTWVSVDLAVDETQVSLKVISELTYPPADEANTPTNLDELQKQLAFYYPNNHSIKIWQEDRINVVTLTISFSTNNLETTPLSRQKIDSIA